MDEYECRIGQREKWSYDIVTKALPSSLGSWDNPLDWPTLKQGCHCPYTSIFTSKNYHSFLAPVFGCGLPGGGWMTWWLGCPSLRVMPLEAFSQGQSTTKHGASGGGTTQSIKLLFIFIFVLLDICLVCYFCAVLNTTLSPKWLSILPTATITQLQWLNISSPPASCSWMAEYCWSRCKTTQAHPSTNTCCATAVTFSQL